jgi:hypothetical protein
MKPMVHISILISRHKWRTLQEISSPLAALLGVTSFIVSGYFGLFLSKFVPPLIDATNAHGISAKAIGLWVAVAFFALVVWIFGCLTARCHSVLYDRWFK